MAKPSLKVRLNRLIDQYGRVAVITYFTLFGLVLVGFAVAVHFGVKLEGTSGAAGTLGIAYAATKVTQPLRILATLVLTPVLGRWFGAPKPVEPRVG
jgi:multisubunit Na+/H+ antiporter MnhG subunit